MSGRVVREVGFEEIRVYHLAWSFDGQNLATQGLMDSLSEVLDEKWPGNW
jgi:hypothetical protein